MTNPKDDEPLARLGDLARQAVRTQSSLLKQSVELTRATVSGDLDRTSAGRAYVEAVSREGARYWRAVGGLGVDYAGDLLSLGNRVATSILADTARAGRTHGHGHRTGHADPVPPSATAPPPAAAGTAGRRVAVTLAGPLGGRAEASVTVANRHPRARRVQLSAGDLTDALGHVVRLVLEVEPARVTIPAGQERTVTLGVDLSDDHVVAGGRYTGTVEVSGGDEATLDVTVVVEG